jgi:hypothetical protein
MKKLHFLLSFAFAGLFFVESNTAFGQQNGANVFVTMPGPALANDGITDWVIQPYFIFRDSQGNILNSGPNGIPSAWNFDMNGSATDQAWINMMTGAFLSAYQKPYAPADPTNDLTWNNAALLSGLADGGYTVQATTVPGGDGVSVLSLFNISYNSTDNRCCLFNSSIRADVNLVNPFILGFYLVNGRVVNMSGRLVVGSNPEDFLILGVTVLGPPGNKEKLYFNAFSQHLAGLGLALLPNVVMDLCDHDGNVVATDYGWSNPVVLPPVTNTDGSVTTRAALDNISVRNSTVADMTATSQPILTAGSDDSAMTAELPPGEYTLVVSSMTGGTGTALAAVYEMPGQ